VPGGGAGLFDPRLFSHRSPIAIETFKITNETSLVESVRGSSGLNNSEEPRAAGQKPGRLINAFLPLAL
jgi:hypothetical protein